MKANQRNDMKVVEFRKPDRQPKHIEVPRLEFSGEYPVGAIHAKTAVTDMEETLGTVGFDRANRAMHIRLNVAHPSIRAAATALDHKTLNYYVAEMCLLGAENMRHETGDWPWPHEDWLDFLADCDVLGCNTRSLDTPLYFLCI